MFFKLQPLLENTKQKLSQFCHVPVSCYCCKLPSETVQMDFALTIREILYLYLVSHRLVIFSMSMMFQTFGMFLFYFGWVF